MKFVPLWLIVFLFVENAAIAQPGRSGGRPPRPRSSDAKLLKKFDRDNNGWLNESERKEAREFHESNRAKSGRRPRRRGPAEPPKPGQPLTPKDVNVFTASEPLYSPNIVRTIFLEFENDNWEDELAAFYHTDVELPAKVQVDGKSYSNVGVQFRGNSSFFTVSKGRKRSMSLSFDHVNAKQNLYGYRALTLLNAHADPSFLRSVLYLDMVKNYLPALKANYVRVVINGESWGIYVNQQRFNKDFLMDAFKTKKGIRFKSANRSRFGSFSYLGEDPAEYRKWYEIKSKDKDESWKPLINVCRVLAKTPPESLKSKLEPIFDIDGALRYLALDIIVQSGDGYWLHGSDFNIYVDHKGVLRILHHDTNEAFTAQGGSRRGENPRPGNAEVDLFASVDDANKALRNKLLKVPEFRTKYLQYVRDIATDSLDWTKLEKKIEGFRSLIAEDIKNDTRKLYSAELFESTFKDDQEVSSANTIKGFFQRRREFILNHPAIKSLGQ